MSLNTKARMSQEVSERETQNRAIAREIAAEGIVLLKNEKNALPLKGKKVALYGAGATKTIAGGTGSGEVNARDYVNVYDGLSNAGFHVTTEKWLWDYEEDFRAKEEEFYKKAKHAIFEVRSGSDFNNILGQSFLYPCGRDITDKDVENSETDTAIYVVARQSGEGADRAVEEFGFTDEEVAQIKFCSEKYDKVIVVINAGCTMDVKDVLDYADALVFMCQLGQEAGNAVADVLTGKVSPSGKTVDTWVKKYADVPCGDTFSYMSPVDVEQNYGEGVFVGYKYYDVAKVDVQYPFGFGLSYTTFDLKAAAPVVSGSEVSVDVTVTNTGSEYKGKEVAQLYLSCPDGKYNKPYKQLAAYAKTSELAPGASETLTLTFDLRDQATYDADTASYILEAGDYVVRVGNCSATTAPCGVLTLDETVSVENTAPIDRGSVAPKEMDLKAEREEISKDVPRVAVAASGIEPIVHDFTYKPETDPAVTAIMDRLTNDDLVKLVIGKGMEMLYYWSGEFVLPGAVGVSTSHLVDKGIPSATFCDGPAGLRVLRESVAYKSGRVRALSSVLSVFDMMPDFIGKLMVGNAKKGDVYYQYCTAFPVGNAIAQTWSVDCAEKFGKAVSVEMTEYGCTFWLAPGMNVHRNPLCGRNFEYYSEDQVLSGKTAAAVTRGVQSQPGNYVTLKHFCVNNQEFLRNTESSNMSDRTLREVYLRNFKIAIKEGDPHGLMTSYNKLNNIYCLENKGLLEDFLRGECGYDGIVMTDWTATSGGLGDAIKAIKNGNDLIQPGMPDDQIKVRIAAKKGDLTPDDLKKAAARMVKFYIRQTRWANK